MAKKAADIQTVAFVSLGCPKNLVDSERMLGLLASDGLAITADHAQADVIVINTCGFLEASKEESLREIRQAVAMKETGSCKRVVVAGCLVQRHKTKLLADVPQIDRLVGVFDREHIVEAVRGKANPRQEHGHFLGKYHDLSRELAGQVGANLVFAQPARDVGANPVFAQPARDVGANPVFAQPARDVGANPVFAQPARDVGANLVFAQASPGKKPTERRSDETTKGSEAAFKETKTNRLPVFEDDRARLRLTPRHYAYLRMSEGCNQGCSFCTIPSIRGPMRSKPVTQIMAEARELAADGAVQLNLIGQDTTSFGTDIGYGPGLSGLLSTLDKKLPADVRWIRLMYAYPSCFTDEMIRTIADSSRVLKYIDMPLQHINDEVLTRMKRRVTRQQIETLLDKLRKWIPGIVIRTTLIAGSPGETDKQHDELVKFVREFGFEMLGVFAYSQEPGTPMGRMDNQLDADVKRQRVEELMLAQQQVAFARAKAMKGRTIEVLVDRPAGRDEEDGWVSRSQGQAPDIDSTVLVKAERLYPGQIVDVKVTGSEGYDLVAELPKKKSRSLTVISGS